MPFATLQVVTTPAAAAAGEATVRVYSDTVWEDLAGFCRAVRRGGRISVSGTTATHRKLAIGAAACEEERPGPPDVAAQMTFVLDKIAAAVKALGGRGLEDVVRTRVFVPRLQRDWEAAARVHGRRFSGIPPANTLVP